MPVSARPKKIANDAWKLVAIHLKFYTYYLIFIYIICSCNISWRLALKFVKVGLEIYVSLWILLENYVGKWGFIWNVSDWMFVCPSALTLKLLRVGGGGAKKTISRRRKEGRVEEKSMRSAPAGPGAQTRDLLRARRGSPAARQGGCLDKQAFPCL